MPEVKNRKCIELRLSFFADGLSPTGKTAWMDGGFKMNQKDNPSRGISGKNVSARIHTPSDVLPALQKILEGKQIKIIDRKTKEQVIFAKV
ncbi:MAG: hypothetical protein WC792_00465 [Candidatus Micrarchaeia archaeon]|jgi:hypothetical protein